MPAEAAPLDAASLLEIWEDTSGLHPVEAALRVLEVAREGAPEAPLPGLPLGTRDAALLALRAQLLGDLIEVTATCPRCHAEIESELSCAALVAAGRAPRDTWVISSGDYRIELQPLTSEDAIVAAVSGGVGAARAILLERAVRHAEARSGPVPAASLPARVVRAISRSLVENDPAAEYLLELRCPDCRMTWTEILDVAPFVVSELRMAARQLFADVDLLARAYGWTESSILALSSTRRAAYAALALG